MWKALSSLFVAGIAILNGIQQEPPSKPVSYSEVSKIFKQRCMPCHNERRRAWGMDLTSYEGLMKGSNNGKVVLPGDAAKSQLVVVIKDTKGLRMPKNGRPLTEKQIQLIEDWIKEGAKKNADG